MKDIAGQVAFVTGGASGIGFATAQALAGQGARVILADIDGARVQTAAAELKAQGADAVGLVLDVTDEASWAAAGAAAEAFGPVRILCSNAGVGGGSGLFEDYDTEVWRWAYAVNAHAHLYACRTFLGAMKAGGEPAHLVLTASMVGIVPPPISVAYISSKFATMGIAHGLRNELAGTNVGISVLCPGMASTRIVETTRDLRPAPVAQGAAAATSQAMGNVLAAGMAPGPIGARVLKAILADEFYIFTHPEWKRLVEPLVAEMLAAFDAPSADPDYAGDDIEALLAANGAKAFGAGIRKA